MQEIPISEVPLSESKDCAQSRLVSEIKPTKTGSDSSVKTNQGRKKQIEEKKEPISRFVGQQQAFQWDARKVAKIETFLQC